MLNELLIWIALLVGLLFLAIDRRRGVGALTLAYFLTLSLGHIPGLLIFLNPNIAVDALTHDVMKAGSSVTLIGMTAFIAGAIAARLLLQPTTSAMANQQALSDAIFSRIGWRLLMMGVVAQFVVLPVAALLPSLTAIVSSLGTFLVLGFWFLFYSAAIANDSRRTLRVLAMLPLLPIGTLTTGGFLSYGTAWVLSIVAFHFVVSRRRVWFYLGAPLVVFLGLSLFVTYFQQREEIRDVIWYQDAGITRRLEQVAKLVTDFQFLDLSDDDHLAAIGQRLNQNYIVGHGVIRHQYGEVGLWYGATVPVWALIPRAIWPDKPEVAGSGDLVSQFTGIEYQEGTSVGAGQVLEFYMNFGMAGVLVGFAILGAILMWLDQRVTGAFVTGNIHGVLQSALPGLALLQPLGSLLEMLLATISAIIVAKLLIHSKLLVPLFTQGSNAKQTGRTTRMIVRR
jgi:hypothetical protein